MKNCIFILFFCMSLSMTAFAQKINFMTSWTEQSQFAGFYMAKIKGFYQEEGLDVNIIHPAMNSTYSVIDELVNGRVQILSYQLSDALYFRARGKKIVNVLQTSQHSSLMCVTREPISSIRDLKGMKIAKWKSQPISLFEYLNRTYQLGINWIPFINGVNLYIFGAVDAMLCYGYSDYYNLISSVGSIDDRCVLSLSDLGIDFPEDGLYVTEKYYSSNRPLIEKFVRATKKGWDYVRNNKEESLDSCINLAIKDNIPINDFTQRHMLDKVLEYQINPLTHNVDYSPVSKESFEKLVDWFYTYGLIKSRINYSDFIKTVN